MKKETYEALHTTAGEISNECTFREEYSGRGMFGRTTFAMVGSQKDIISLIAETAATLGRDEGIAEQNYNCGNGTEKELDDATNARDNFLIDIGNLSWDEMGRRSLIAY